MNFLPILFYCTLYALLNVCGAAVIKKELLFIKLESVMDFLHFVFRPLVIVGFFIIFLSSLVMFKALSVSKLSLIAPVSTGINFALTLFIGFYIFNERLTLVQFGGISLILVGIWIIAFAKQV